MKYIGEHVTLACSLEKNCILYIDSRIHNIHGHWRDFFSFLCWLPDLKLFREAVVVSKYRNTKLKWILDWACSYAAEGIHQPCASATILGEHKFGLPDYAHTSITNSMVSFSLGNCPSSSDWQWLIVCFFPKMLTCPTSSCGVSGSSLHERISRKRPRSRSSPGHAQWCDEPEQRQLPIALVKEIGWYCTMFRLALTCETMSKDLLWKGHSIHVRTTVYINTMNWGKNKNSPVYPAHWSTTDAWQLLYRWGPLHQPWTVLARAFYDGCSPPSWAHDASLQFRCWTVERCMSETHMWHHHMIPVMRRKW